MRVRIDTMLQTDPFHKARITTFPDAANAANQNAIPAFRKLLEDYFDSMTTERPTRVMELIESAPPGALVDALSTALDATYSEQLALLAATDVAERIKLMAVLLPRSKSKRIGPSRALVPAGSKATASSDVDKLKDRLLQAEITVGEARDSIMADFEKLSRMSKSSSEYQV